MQFLTPQLKKDLVISALVLIVLYGMTHNAITRPKPEHKKGYWNIELIQHPLIFGFFGHNYLVLRNEDGHIEEEIHGLATNPITKQWKYVGNKPTDILQAWTFETPRNAEAETLFPGIVLTQGDQETVQLIWNNGKDCIAPINEQDIPYPPFGIRVFGTTENSNSVTSTLVQCMGLKIKHIGLFTPGAGKTLLTILNASTSKEIGK
jgi:hypothetical protein